MYNEYIALYQQYTQTYGPKTAIFLMVGSFYELYDIQDRETGTTRCNVREIVDLLGIQLSTKQSGELSDHEVGLFAGFPEYVLHKWAGRLTSVGWTVVIVDQIKDARGKVKERTVSRILSPSTHMENIPSTETPYLATLYFHSTHAASPPSYGAALLDLTTGTTRTYTGQTYGRADVWTADDVVQLLSVFSPKEVLLYWHSPAPLPDSAFVCRLFGFASHLPVHIRQVETLGSFSKELARAEYLQRIYSIRSLLPPRTYLGLRSDEEETALLYLLQFIEEHSPSMVRSFHRNESWTPQTRLICGNHALTQLQMTSATSPHESILGLFSSCITPMGKRSLKERLLSPYATAPEIRARLAEVGDYLSWPEDRVAALERQLRYLYDLPRLHRRLLCGLISPTEIAALFQSYRATHTILTTVTPHTTLAAPFSEEEWDTYFSLFSTHFSEDKASRASADVSAFHSQTYPDIGAVEEELAALLTELEALRTTYVLQGGVGNDTVRLEEREKEPYGIKASSVTLQHLKKKLAHLPEGTKIAELKSGGWVECPTLHTLNTRIVQARTRLDQLVRTHLPDACVALSTHGFSLWSFLEEWISHVDHTQCIGKVSAEQGYVCPTVEDPTPEHGSLIEITQLRHPLVEMSPTSRVAYVKHDVALGGCQGSEAGGARGWLVYGMNASGKSTLMKATGVCVLLAQAGCYVPAQSMRIAPFHAVYTRILNQDNLFAGLSSFAVEMSELRDILRNATPYTLVLGDELCSGTESISAQALVASGIQWLRTKKAAFMFATHLHDLPSLLDDQGHDADVKVWHLHVEYDPLKKTLIYDRSLRPGSGSTLYGIEVARAMDLPAEWIDMALQYRHRILGTTTQENAPSSSWNRQVVRRTCEQCQQVIQRDLEVHHVVPRSAAVRPHGILADGTSVHDVRNLIVLCTACHDAIHAGHRVVAPMKMTSDGPLRIPGDPTATAPATVTLATATAASRHGKWTEEEHAMIQQTLQTYPTLSLKSIRAKLDAAYGIRISETILGRHRRAMEETAI